MPTISPHYQERLRHEFRVQRIRLASVKWYLTHNKKVPTTLWSPRIRARLAAGR